MSMKFLIVSDTHGRMYNLEEAMEREEFDGMIHCCLLYTSDAADD